MDLLKDFKLNISVEKIKVLFKYFFSDGVLPIILLLLSFIYIFFAEKNKKIRDFFIWYTIIILVIIWNPIIVHILEEFINFSSLYRIYYMIPMYPIIAYALTKIACSFNKKTLKYITVFAVCFVAIVFGKDIYSDDWKLTETNNLYKLPR